MQDVNFRWFLQKKAQELGVFGFVLNAPGGIVYCEAEGDKGALDQFIAHCHLGPRFARVDKVEVEESQMKDFKEFKVTH